MADLPLERLRELELRYDGPVPAQYHETELTLRRRRRGMITLLESQAADFLDAAIRCQAEIEELMTEADERTSAARRQSVAGRRLALLRERLASHMRSATEALVAAAALRRELALEPHPLVGISALLTAA